MLNPEVCIECRSIEVKKGYNKEDKEETKEFTKKYVYNMAMKQNRIACPASLSFNWLVSLGLFSDEGEDANYNVLVRKWVLDLIMEKLGEEQGKFFIDNYLFTDIGLKGAWFDCKRGSPPPFCPYKEKHNNCLEGKT